MQNGTEEVSIYLPYEMKNIAFMEEIGNMDKKIAFMEESDGPINIFWLYGRDEVEFMEENGLNTHIRVFLKGHFVKK